MDKEYVILNHIHKDGNTTQRDIAVNAGISVGAVNLLLQNMVKKGLVKIERLNAKSLRYILTPKGIQEKIRLTYNYTRLSYRRIALISEGVKVLVRSRKEADPLKEVILFGPEDEIREIVKMGLSGTTYQCYQDKFALDLYLTGNKPRHLFLVWRLEDEALIQTGDREIINVLEFVGM